MVRLSRRQLSCRRLEKSADLRSVLREMSLRCSPGELCRVPGDSARARYRFNRDGHIVPWGVLDVELDDAWTLASRSLPGVVEVPRTRMPPRARQVSVAKGVLQLSLAN